LGGGSFPGNIFNPPGKTEKCVGHSLQLLGIVKKIWAPLRKLFAPLVSQADCMPAPARSTIQAAACRQLPSPKLSKNLRTLIAYSLP